MSPPELSLAFAFSAALQLQRTRQQTAQEPGTHKLSSQVSDALELVMGDPHGGRHAQALRGPFALQHGGQSALIFPSQCPQLPIPLSSIYMPLIASIAQRGKWGPR